MKLLLMEEILHQLIGTLSHYLQGFIHPRWWRISSINSIIGEDFFRTLRTFKVTQNTNPDGLVISPISPCCKGELAEKNGYPGCLGYTGGYKLPCVLGFIMSHCRDPY